MPSQVPPASRSRPARTPGWSSQNAAGEQRRKTVALGQSAKLRLEALRIGDVLVDLHPRGLVVAAPQQPSADSGDLGELALHRADRRARARGILRRNAIVDVIAELHATA